VAPSSDAERRVGSISLAFADIQLAEAARVLSLLETDGLGGRAVGWISDGIDTPTVRALAQSADAATGIRLALVAEIAAEFGIGFATLQDARRLYAEHIIRAMGTGDNFGGDIYALSNGYTDELVARIRGFVGRMLRRHD
jgi:hypothetical protein